MKYQKIKDQEYQNREEVKQNKAYERTKSRFWNKGKKSIYDHPSSRIPKSKQFEFNEIMKNSRPNSHDIIDISSKTLVYNAIKSVTIAYKASLLAYSDMFIKNSTFFPGHEVPSLTPLIKKDFYDPFNNYYMTPEREKCISVYKEKVSAFKMDYQKYFHDDCPKKISSPLALPDGRQLLSTGVLITEESGEKVHYYQDGNIFCHDIFKTPDGDTFKAQV